MPNRTFHRQGTPSWVELTAPDHQAAGPFYGTLSGWEFGAGLDIWAYDGPTA